MIDIQAEDSAVAFFNRLYNEALALTQEARDHVVGTRGLRRSLPSELRLVVSCEEMRVTARMTQVMAWLLVQKAVHAGELTREDARAPAYRLAGQEICLDESRLDAEELDAELLARAPLVQRLADLDQRSRALYERVQRLDTMLDRRS